MARRRPRESDLVEEFQPQTRKLVRIYEQARDLIILNIAATSAKEMASQRLRIAKLAQIEQLIRETTRQAREWAIEVMPTVYKRSVIETRKDILRAGGSIRSAGLGGGGGGGGGSTAGGLGGPGGPDDPILSITTRFGGIHRKQAEILTNNIIGKFEAIEDFIGRKVADDFRRASLDVISDKILGSAAEGESIKQGIIRAFDERGLPAFRDRLGREWQTDRYAEMVARTTTREVITSAEVYEGLLDGYDLLDVDGISAFPDTSPCVPFEGKQLSATGRTPGYTTLADAISEGLFHPNCTKGVTPVVSDESSFDPSTLTAADFARAAPIVR